MANLSGSNDDEGLCWGYSPASEPHNVARSFSTMPLHNSFVSQEGNSDGLIGFCSFADFGPVLLVLSDFPRTRSSSLLRSVVEAGLLGQAPGNGFELFLGEVDTDLPLQGP